MADGEEAEKPRGAIRSPQDFAGGISLLLLSAFALWQGANLPMGTLGGMGSGMVPITLAVGLGILGAALLATSFLYDGETLSRWPLRAILFVVVAIVAFGLTVRPLGLAVAGPLVVLISGLATSDTRWIETTIFGIVMTAFCLGLFRFMLALPIPVAPWLIGY